MEASLAAVRRSRLRRTFPGPHPLGHNDKRSAPPPRLVYLRGVCWNLPHEGEYGSIAESILTTNIYPVSCLAEAHGHVAAPSAHTRAGNGFISRALHSQGLRRNLWRPYTSNGRSLVLLSAAIKLASRPMAWRSWLPYALEHLRIADWLSEERAPRALSTPCDASALRNARQLLGLLKTTTTRSPATSIVKLADTVYFLSPYCVEDIARTGFSHNCRRDL